MLQLGRECFLLPLKSVDFVSVRRWLCRGGLSGGHCVGCVCGCGVCVRCVWGVCVRGSDAIIISCVKDNHSKVNLCVRYRRLRHYYFDSHHLTASLSI